MDGWTKGNFWNFFVAHCVCNEHKFICSGDHCFNTLSSGAQLGLRKKEKNKIMMVVKERTLKERIGDFGAVFII